MASKLKIDNKKVESVPSSRNSTPSVGGMGNATFVGAEAGLSSAPGSSATAASGPFRGQGQSLSGKKSKGKKERAIEPLDPFSMIRRTDMPNVVTNDTQIGEKKVPAALRLPFGKLYFGYDYVPLGGVETREGPGKEDAAVPQQRVTFSGVGQTLSGRAPRRPAGTDDEATAQSSQSSSATPVGDQGNITGADSPVGVQGQGLDGAGGSGGRGRGLRPNLKRDRGKKALIPGNGESRTAAIVVYDDEDDDDD